MSKMFVLTIGYTRYAFSGEDAMKLMKIASRGRLVVNAKDYRSFEFSADENEIISDCALADVREPAPPEPYIEKAPLQIEAPKKALRAPEEMF